MNDPRYPGLPEAAISEEFPEWAIEPIGIGWNATRTTNDGGTIHTVGAPTVAELRGKLREIRAREERA